MAHSFAQSIRALCPRCKHPATLKVWLIVDLIERPDLVARILTGEIHHAACPHCNRVDQVNAPLLIHDPEGRRVLFVPSQGATPEQDEQIAQQLMGHLVESFLYSQPDYLDWAHVVPPDLLVAALEGTLNDVGAGTDPPVPSVFRADLQRAEEGEQRYLQSNDRTALDQAVTAWERIMKHQGFFRSPESFQLTALNNAGRVFLHRYWSQGDIEDLNRALHCWQQVLERIPSNSSDLAIVLNNLGNGLRNRYTRTGQLSDLEEAIGSYQQAIEHTSSDSPTLPSILNNLSNGLRNRYECTGRLEDLEHAISVSQRAVERTPPDSPDLSTPLTNLGNGLRTRYARTGRLADLEEAIGLYQQAVERASSDTPNLHMYLTNLGNGLVDRYTHSGRLADLEEAISVYRRAVEHTPPDSPDLPTQLNNLSNGLRTCYGRTEQLADLEEAIGLSRRAVERTPADSPDLAGFLTNLGNSLSILYAHGGRLADLEEAIRVCQRAEKCTPPDSPDLPVRLNNLSNILRVRHARTGLLADLEEAVSVSRRAVEYTPADSPALPSILNNLGVGLSVRYARMGRLEDLEETIDVSRRAVECSPPHSPDLPPRLNTLGNGLIDRYACTGRLEDLEEAIGVYRQAVARTPPDSPDLAPILNDLGNSLRDRYARTGRLEDLDEAIGVYQWAVERTSADSPDLPPRLNNLGVGLCDRYAYTGRLEDLEKAIDAYTDACRLGAELYLEESLRASRNWGDWALERRALEEASRAYDYGLQAIERLFRGQLLRASKESWLREARGLHARAAYALARTGGLTQAVEALDRGRARLLAEVLERDHARLKELATSNSEVYEQYASASERLRLLEGQELGGQMVLPEGQSLADAIRQARADLEAAVQDIRQVPSYEEFLQPPTFVDIQASVAPGCPLVYFAVTPAGAVALIANQEDNDRSPVRVVWVELTEDILFARITGYTPEEAQHEFRGEGIPAERLGGYLGAYARWRRSPGDPAARRAWFDTLDGTCRWLWDALMGPLVEALAGMGADRAVLIPQGWLGLLPLHAAYTDIQVPGTYTRRYAMDEVCFTYAPNARALLAARRTAARVEPDRLLAVDELRPVSANPLPNSAREVMAACAHFEEPQVLGGEAATEQAVREQLAAHSVLHFSCHGIAGFAQPLEGGLLLAHDERLTLRDILALRLENARLAVLSACETGIPGTELPDEVVSLPTGLVQAGVAGVVASLWSVSDLSTMMLMARFYDGWVGEGLEPPEALRQAQQWVRDTTNGDKRAYLETKFGSENVPTLSAWERPEENDFAHPVYWAAFTYTGA